MMLAAGITTFRYEPFGALAMTNGSGVTPGKWTLRNGNGVTPGKWTLRSGCAVSP
jgi:hypothetical protein